MCRQAAGCPIRKAMLESVTEVRVSQPQHSWHFGLDHSLL